jgi:hypothetical protein
METMESTLLSDQERINKLRSKIRYIKELQKEMHALMQLYKDKTEIEEIAVASYQSEFFYLEDRLNQARIKLCKLTGD